MSNRGKEGARESESVEEMMKRKRLMKVRSLSSVSNSGLNSELHMCGLMLNHILRV